MATGLTISDSRLSELSEAINWSAVTDEAVDLLRQYIQFPTVNDPFHLSTEQAETCPWIAGNEAAAAKWLKTVLNAEGIAAELLESAPERVNLIARLRSENPQKSPLIFLSHSDVVPANPQEWDGDIGPFAGAVHKGYVYGRGALDLKGLGIAHLIVIMLLHRLRVPLKRDVVLLIVADEEAGGQFGAQWLLKQKPELLDSELVLGEGGFSVQDFWYGRDIHAISVAEKGCIELELSAKDAGHHASMPSSSASPLRLIAALHHVLSLNLPLRLTLPTRTFLARLAAAVPGLKGQLLRMPMVSSKLLARHLSHIPAINAMLRDTIALTILESGVKSNLVPGQSRAVLNIRLLPGSSDRDLITAIRRIIADSSVKIRCLHSKAPNWCDFENPYFSVLEKHAMAGGKSGIVVPILSPGASDCRHWRYAGVKCYGWVPFPISHQGLAGVHGRNERVAIQSLQHGIRALYHAALEIVTG